MSEFEAFYEMKITPILKQYDLADPSLCDRISPENIFSRLFEVTCPEDVEKISEALKADGVWKQLLSVMG